MEETSAAEHRARIDEFLRRFGRERGVEVDPLSEQGVTRVQRGSAIVWIHVIHEQGVLLLLSPLMKVPAEGREALYRRLLELSFLATGDGAFAINKGTDEIFLRGLRRLDGLDYEEFEDLVHTIARVADEWDDRLRSEFGG